MGNEIKHDPITGEPMLPTEDLSQAQLDPVTEHKLTQEEYAKRQQNMIPPAGYGGQMGPMPQAGQAIRPGMVPPMVPKAMRANGIWTPEKAQYVAQKKINDNKSKAALCLCIISLVLWIFARVIFYGSFVENSIIKVFFEYYYLYLPASIMWATLILILVSIFGPYILLIIARVKYKYNKFGKVLQWIYIGEVALFVVLFRLIFLFLL